MINVRMRSVRAPLIGLALVAVLVAAACGGGAPAGSNGGNGGNGATSPGASGGGAVPEGPMSGKKLCAIVTLEQATEILGEAPPRGEASDDRLAKSHTCAYKPGPKLILQVQVIEGIADEAAFDAYIAKLPQSTPAEGVGEKAVFISRTEPPPGPRLYVLANGHIVVVNIGSDRVPEADLQPTALSIAPSIIGAL